MKTNDLSHNLIVFMSCLKGYAVWFRMYSVGKTHVFRGSKAF